MKDGAYLVNTSRGGLIDTQALINGLLAKKFGGVGLDVYEEEEGLFYEDCSDEIIQDDNLARLTTFPNVLITSHMGFFTVEAHAVHRPRNPGKRLRPRKQPHFEKFGGVGIGLPVCESQRFLVA